MRSSLCKCKLHKEGFHQKNEQRCKCSCETLYLCLHNFSELCNLFSRVLMGNCFWCYFRQLYIIAEPRRLEDSLSGAPERKGNRWIDFLRVIMASGIARGRVGTTTATESRKMAAILQLIGWQRHTALVYRVLLWNWTSLLWLNDTCQIKVSADQYHVKIWRAQV